MPERSALAPFRSQLGQIPDQQIADLARVSRTLVVNYRKKLGIPPYQGHKVAPDPSAPLGEPGLRPFRGRRSVLDGFVDRLGHVPDAELARLAGVTAENVRTYRRRRGIPAFWQLGGPPTGTVGGLGGLPALAEAPAGPQGTGTRAAPGGAQAAFLVTLDTQSGARSYVVLAADFASAAAHASARADMLHPGASIRALQRVAELFPTVP